MKKMIACFLLMINIVVMMPTTTYANEESLQLYAQAAILMDGDSGRILYSKNGQETKANASTTKVLTCILALEMGNLDEIAVASKEAAMQPKVHLGVKEGEEYYLKDMLYALMLESYNDSAVIIAEHIGGSVESYMSMMNQKAVEIGCKNTYFITPNGLDGEEGYEYHHSTAEDLALILRYATLESPKKEEYLEITRTPSYTFSEVSGARSYTCTNRNSLLSIMSEAVSGKTGFTNAAGYCYVGSIESEGRSFIVALLGCGWPGNRTYKWSDCEKLFSYGKEYYTYVEVEKESINVPNLMATVLRGKSVDDKAQVSLRVNYSSNFRVLMREDEEVEVIAEFQNNLFAPVVIGDVVGSMRYVIGEKLIQIDTIVASESMEESDFLWELKKRWLKK